MECNNFTNNSSIDKLSNRALSEPISNPGCCATIVKIVTVVANFFRTIALWLVETASCLTDRVIDLFSERTASRNMPQFETSAMHSSASIEILTTEQGTVVEKYAERLRLEKYSFGLSTQEIEAVTALSAEEREGVITGALQLCYSSIKTSDRVDIIQVVKEIPKDGRKEIVNAISCICTGLEGDSERTTIIKEIRDKIMVLLIPGVSMEQQWEFIRPFKQILRTMSMDTVSRIAQMIGPDWREYAMEQIFFTEEIDNIIATVWSLLPSELNWSQTSEVISLIQVVQEIPKNQRAAAGDISRSLTASTELNRILLYREQILAAIKNMSAAQIMVVWKYAHRICNGPRLLNGEKIQIIQYVADIVVKMHTYYQRKGKADLAGQHVDQVMRCACLMSNSNARVEDKIRTLRDVVNMTSEQRDQYLKQIITQNIPSEGSAGAHSPIDNAGAADKAVRF